MILVIMRMKVSSKKRSELSQAIVSLTGSIRAKKGCRSCDFCQSLQNENELCLIEEWDTRKDLMAHLKSEHFRVLLGAMNLKMMTETFHEGHKPPPDASKRLRGCIRFPPGFTVLSSGVVA